MYLEAAQVLVVGLSSLPWREKHFLKFPLRSLKVKNPLVIKLVSHILEMVLLGWGEGGKGPHLRYLFKRALDEESDRRHLLLLSNSVDPSQGLFLDRGIPKHFRVIHSNT